MLQRVAQGAVGPAVDECGAGIGGVQAQDDPHGGGFAGSVGSGEAGDQPRADGEGHAVQGVTGTVSFVQSGDDDLRGGHRGGFVVGNGCMAMVVRGGGSRLGRGGCDRAGTGGLGWLGAWHLDPAAGPAVPPA
jgi:hypothetical protein